MGHEPPPRDTRPDIPQPPTESSATRQWDDGWTSAEKAAYEKHLAARDEIDELPLEPEEWRALAGEPGHKRHPDAVPLAYLTTEGMDAELKRMMAAQFASGEMSAHPIAVLNATQIVMKDMFFRIWQHIAKLELDLDSHVGESGDGAHPL